MNWKKLSVLGILVIFGVPPLIWDLGTSVLNLLIMLFIYIILAQSWNLMGGYTGQINLGLAAFFGCGTMVTHFIWKAGLPFYLAMAAGGVAAMVLAVIIGLPTLRLKGMYFGIGTFALAEVCRIVVGSTFQRMLRMPNEYVASYSLISRYYVAFVVAALAVVIVYRVTHSKLGLGMVAVRDDETAAQVTGVNTFKCKVLALFISALLAGLAGGVFAYLRLSFHYIFMMFSPVWTFEPLMAAIIGGAGTLAGPIVGSIFLVILSEIFALKLGEAHLIIFGFLFVLVVMYFPQGLVGSLDRIRPWFRRSWSRRAAWEGQGKP
jgi:branched-chain amino acid transport system permease protein